MATEIKLYLLAFALCVMTMLQAHTVSRNDDYRYWLGGLRRATDLDIKDVRAGRSPYRVDSYGNPYRLEVYK